MNDTTRRELRIGSESWRWFRQQAERSGVSRAVGQACTIAWQFLRESMPDRRRQRYGDVDYDWDFRVDTTAATVGWRERLIGLMNSPYQPTDPALFREMMAVLDIDFQDYVFIDVGSGKGRVLLMAADYPFRKIMGIELLSELHCVAQENIQKYKSDSQKCFQIESVCGDATEFEFPAGAMVVYLFNSLPEPGLVQMLGNLEKSLREHARPIFLVYSNPLLEETVLGPGFLRKIGGTSQFTVCGNSY